MPNNDPNSKKKKILIGPGSAFDEIVNNIEEAFSESQTTRRVQPNPPQGQQRTQRGQSTQTQTHSRMSPAEVAYRALGNYIHSSEKRYNKLKDPRIAGVIKEYVRSLNEDYKVIDKRLNYTEIYINFLKDMMGSLTIEDNEGHISFFPKNVKDAQKIKDAYEQFFDYLGKKDKKSVNLPPDFYTKKRFDKNKNLTNGYKTWLKDNPWSFEAFVRYLWERGYTIKKEKDKYVIDKNGKKIDLSEGVREYLKTNALEGTYQLINRFTVVKVPYLKRLIPVNPLSSKGRKMRTMKYQEKKEENKNQSDSKNNNTKHGKANKSP